MFFPEKIKSIKKTDKVLEVGPGATPYKRANVFLELNYINEAERIAQSGNVGVLKTKKEVIFYDGKAFPFKNKEFDFAVCSHVIEHVEDPDFFVKELCRVAKSGYIEFPTVFYDYLYDFDEHINFVFYDGKCINWIKKDKTPLNFFKPITEQLKNSFQKNQFYVNTLKEHIFQGFEWTKTIQTKQVDSITLITPSIQFKQDLSFRVTRKMYYYLKKIFK